MNKKETINLKVARQLNHETNKMNTSENSKKRKQKDLPWWVELLFVQIGLPDKFLIKILKAKKNSRELKMLSTNFCYGGIEIYEIENLIN